jgi:hypothetical protein
LKKIKSIKQEISTISQAKTVSILLKGINLFKEKYKDDKEFLSYFLTTMQLRIFFGLLDLAQYKLEREISLRSLLIL